MNRDGAVVALGFRGREQHDGGGGNDEHRDRGFLAIHAAERRSAAAMATNATHRAAVNRATVTAGMSVE